MSPEWLPVMVLLLGGVFAGSVALNFLFTGRPSQAVRAGVAGLACFLLAFLLVRIHGFHSRHGLYASHGASTHRPPKPLVLRPAARDSTGVMMLLLGGVLLRVAPSNRYELSVDRERFLTLDSLGTGLIVDCRVGAKDEASTEISRSLFPFYAAGVQPGRPDSSTLLVREKGKDIFRVHYANLRRIEVTGRFFAGETDGPAVISFERGIRWRGGGVPPGATIDLTRGGKGSIDFQRSGLIQISHP